MNTASLERTFSQADFDAFARLSGDDNPIHVDADFSAGTRFGRTVAHGLLLCTVLRGLSAQLAPGTGWRSHRLMFPAPTFADEPMRFVATLHPDQQRIELTVTRVADGTVTCQGEAGLGDAA